MRFKLWLFPLMLMGSGLLLARGVATSQSPAGHEVKLWSTVTRAPKGPKGAAPAIAANVKVTPGNEAEAKKYYEEIRANLAGFPRTTLAESSIVDMLGYYGFPALPPASLEELTPATIMDFDQLRKAISTPEFEAAYRDHPLGAGEILVSRFFAPKIINVSDKQVDGVPVGGFGWRKVLRFRSREGSLARAAGLDSFYLLFNFTSGSGTSFPEKIHAAQIQGMLTPVYPSTGKHRDSYFLVYESLAAATPGQVGFYLNATFDLVSAVPDGKYYVPRACGQCHGTEASDQKGAKVNYLDTDHWIDRTGDDFKKVPAGNVLPDGAASYATFRQLNTEIAKQNESVIAQSGGKTFALLAARKWLDLHKEGQPGADQHVPALKRGFAEKAGDAVWTEGAAPDEKLLPLLNQYCFRCHSSVRYHVFQKQAVIDKKTSILGRIQSGNMPQDRDLDQATEDELVSLLNQLK
jgi:hypothetical protein